MRCCPQTATFQEGSGRWIIGYTAVSALGEGRQGADTGEQGRSTQGGREGPQGLGDKPLRQKSLADRPCRGRAQRS